LKDGFVHECPYQFDVDRIVATGTYGTVCLVHDAAEDKRWALKVLKTQHMDNPKVVSRLRDEAMLLSRMHHPHIVHVEDLVEVEGRPVIVMEWVDGCDLEELLNHLPQGLPFPEAVRLVQVAATTLNDAYASPSPNAEHPLGVIHRDVKPSNFLLDLEGTLKLVDFGTARCRFDGRESETISMVLGARAYLAPERLDGEQDSPRGDIYALGHVLFELLGGGPLQLSLHPYHHQQMMDVRLGEFDLPGVSQETASAAVSLIRDMCAYVVDERPSYGEVIERLQGLLDGHPVSPDLRVFAGDCVPEVQAQRPEIPPQTHPSWAEVAFLNPQYQADRTRELNARIRDFLRRPDWMSEYPHLQRLLDTTPHWTAEPFIERLKFARERWWEFWKPHALSDSELIELLATLRLRPGPQTLRVAQQYLEHMNAAVRQRAKALMQRED